MDCGCFSKGGKACAPKRPWLGAPGLRRGACPTSRSQDSRRINSSNTRQIQKTTLFQGPGYLKLFTLIQNHMLGLHPSSVERRAPSVQLLRT